MLHRRIYQFLIVYVAGLSLLFLIKHTFGLSDYVIPSLQELRHTARGVVGRYVFDVLDTLSVAVVGHVLSIVLASVVGIIGRLTTWIGSFIKVAAYNIQAYPIVAVAPIIFILLGDGLSSRLLITAMICYFPLLLSIMGVLTEPVETIEHFYTVTDKTTWQLEVKIRAFESLHKLTTVIVGSATLAMVGTIVSEFIAADAGIGHSIRIALYQSDLARILVALFLIGICTSLYLTLLEWIGGRIQRHLNAPLGP
jgi:NitT/TauT family transport system permease protein